MSKANPMAATAQIAHSIPVSLRCMYLNHATASSVLRSFAAGVREPLIGVENAGGFLIPRFSLDLLGVGRAVGLDRLGDFALVSHAPVLLVDLGDLPFVDVAALDVRAGLGPHHLIGSLLTLHYGVPLGLAEILVVLFSLRPVTGRRVRLALSRPRSAT